MGKELPPMEHRFVFVQFVRRQKCRFNQSFSGFFDLPPTIRKSVLDKWEKSHPRMNLPQMKISDKPRRRKSA